jgi:tight adherence protein B
VTAASAVLLLLAAVLVVTAGRSSLRERLGVPHAAYRVLGRLRRSVVPVGNASPRQRRALQVGAAIGAGCGGWLGAGPVAAAFAGTYAVVVLRGVQASRDRTSERAAAAAVEDLVSGLAADLRAGLAPAAALHAGIEALSFGVAPVTGRASSWGGGIRTDRTRGPGSALRVALAPVLAATSSGDDVATALRRVRLPGAGAGTPRSAAEGGLAKLAAAWQVADHSGAPLADVLDRLDAELGAARRLRERSEAHTAAATATVRLLATLPLLGIGIGYALGGDPVTVLFHSAAGMVCAVVALLLQVTGLLWADRLTVGRPARGSPRSPSTSPGRATDTGAGRVAPRGTATVAASDPASVVAP